MHIFECHSMNISKQNVASQFSLKKGNFILSTFIFCFPFYASVASLEPFFTLSIIPVLIPLPLVLLFSILPSIINYSKIFYYKQWNRLWNKWVNCRLEFGQISQCKLNYTLPAIVSPWLSMHITPETPGSLILLKK